MYKMIGELTHCEQSQQPGRRMTGVDSGSIDKYLSYVLLMPVEMSTRLPDWISLSVHKNFQAERNILNRNKTILA